MRPLVPLVSLLLLAACANADPPPRASSDPSNADAARGVSPLAAAAGSAQAAPTGHEHHPGMDMGGMDMGAPDGGPTAAGAVADAGAQATKYQCPMHADVIRDAPGRCPKCGMTLVPIVKAPPK